MKFLQIKFREKQSDWFGKRGISWHISTVLSCEADDEAKEWQSYAHLVDGSCQQDWFAVLKMCWVLSRPRNQTSQKHSLGMMKRDAIITTTLQRLSETSEKEVELISVGLTSRNRNTVKMFATAYYVQ